MNNNDLIRKESGFTLVEILVAVFIMSVGFLALSQMGFLSLKLKQMAADGTDATNIVQYVVDRDISEVKKVYLLNAQVFLDVLMGRTPDFTYCNGSSDNSICATCPCDPLESVTANPDPTVVGSEFTCTTVNLDNFDPLSLDFTTDETTCSSTLESLGSEGMIIVKSAHTTQDDDIITLSLTYAAKSLEQFLDSAFSVTIRDSLVTQNFEITAQIEDYTDTVPITSGPNWDKVRVPHVP